MILSFKLREEEKKKKMNYLIYTNPPPPLRCSNATWCWTLRKILIQKSSDRWTVLEKKFLEKPVKGAGDEIFFAPEVEGESVKVPYRPMSVDANPDLRAEVLRACQEARHQIVAGQYTLGERARFLGLKAVLEEVRAKDQGTLSLELLLCDPAHEYELLGNDRLVIRQAVATPNAEKGPTAQPGKGRKTKNDRSKRLKAGEARKTVPTFQVTEHRVVASKKVPKKQKQGKKRR